MRKNKRYIGILSAYGRLSVTYCDSIDIDGAYDTMEYNTGSLIVMNERETKNIIKLLQKTLRRK